MKNYLETLLTEKNIDLEETLVIDANTRYSHIYTYQQLIEDIVEITKGEPKMREAIKKNFVMIDFRNGDVTDYFKHLAKGLVKAYGAQA